MKPRISTRLMMMVAAVLMSFAPAATITTQKAAAFSTCDQAQFIADVTVPDGTPFSPGAAFTKTWRLKNIGSCAWTTSYALVFDTGTIMGGPAAVNLPSNVAPGQTVDISINLTAPGNAGHYIGYWKFRNSSGLYSESASHPINPGGWKSTSLLALLPAWLTILQLIIVLHPGITSRAVCLAREPTATHAALSLK